MRTRSFCDYLFLALLVVSCSAGYKQPSATGDVVVITSPAERSLPLIHGWRLADDLLVSQDGYLFTILGVLLTGANTQIVYSLSGCDSRQFFKENRVELIDDHGRIIEYLRVVPLAKIGEVEPGILAFARRYEGTSALYLQLGDTVQQMEVTRMLLARFDGPPAEDRLFSTYFAFREGAVEQEGYRFKLYLGYVTTAAMGNDLATPAASIPYPGATSTAIPTPVIPAELPQGVEVQVPLSLMIENVKERWVEDLYFQLLSDGNVIGLYNGAALLPTPVWAVTLTPTVTPYP